MDKFEKYMLPSQTVTLKNEKGEEDVFTLEPLGFKYFPKILRLARAFSGLQGLSPEDVAKDPSKFLTAFSEDVVKDMDTLVIETLVRSYPDQPREKLEKFAGANMMEFLPIVLELNTPKMGDGDSMDIKEKMELLKQHGTTELQTKKES